MKKSCLFFIFSFLCAAFSFAETKKINQPIQDPNAEYRIFETSNSVFYLKLNTRNGAVNAIKLNYDGTVLAEKTIHEGEKVSENPGTYTLYPTELPFVFLLLNQKTGQITNVSWMEVLK